MKDARQIAPIQVRIPPDLKDWIKEEAARNGRSQNTEIVFCLQEARRMREEPAQ